LPDGIHTGPYPESWNGQWQQFFQNNVNPSAQDILDYLGRLRDKFGI
jgi:hypothetical protein